ncbi:MAG: hypothetical protein WD886_06365, partial [Burkholderiales bacterium]
LRAESRSTGMGIFYTMYYAGVAVIPPIAGAIAVWTASSAAPIWMAVACAATSAGAFSMVRWLQKSAAA